MPEIEKNTQLKNIAISSYFLILISWLMLLIKKNPNFSNKFVKSHIKVAFLLHLLIFSVIIIFLFYWNFNFFSFYNFNSNQIISSILLFFLFLALLYWMYKAYLWENMNIKEFNIKNKKNKIVNLQDNIKITEKWIFSIILTYIPFLGFLLSWKIKSGSFLNILKFNTYFTIFLIIIYIFWKNSTWNFLVLAYTIFIVLTWIMLVINRTFIKINLSKIPSFSEINDYLKIFFNYIINFFKNNFLEFSKVKKIYFEKKEKKEILELEKLNKNKDLQIYKKLIYFPILNFIFIFFINTKYKNHIINWILLSILTIIFYFFNFNKYYYLFIIMWIFYWIWNLKNINYKFPFLYNFYELFKNIFIKFNNLIKIFKQKKSEVKKETFKVKD